MAWLLATASSGDPLLDWASRAGAAAIMALGLVSFIRGWIVPKPEVERILDENKQLRVERDRALDLVYKQAEVSSRAVQALADAREKWPDLHE